MVCRYVESVLKLPRTWRHASQTVLSRLAGSPRRSFQPGSDTLERALIVQLGDAGEMMATLPLIWAIRENWPNVSLTVATREAGRDLARICPAVNEVTPIPDDLSYLDRFFFASRRLQNFDAAIAVSPSYDRWLARLIRLTNAPVRIGIEPTPLMHTPFFYTHNMKAGQLTEHLASTFLRLAEPLQPSAPPDFRFNLTPGPDARYNARTLAGDLTKPVGDLKKPVPFVVVDISSDTKNNWNYQQYADFVAGLAGDRRVPVAITYQDRDLATARKLTEDVKTFAPVCKIPTRDLEQLAAVFQIARVVFTPNYAIGHLAAAVDAPAVILWYREDFERLHSLHPTHLFLRADEEPESATPTFAINLMAEAWQNHPDDGHLPPPTEDTLA